MNALAIGEKIAAPIAGGIVGGLMRPINDQRQYEQQKRLTKIQTEANKELSDYGKENQMDLWNRTNYGAQVDHMKQAGLNVGLMYGQAGGGGMTGSGEAGSAGMGAAPQGGGEMEYGMQLALMNAQKENIEADTRNKEASTEGTRTDTVGKGYQNQITNASLDSQILKIRREAEIELQRLQQEMNKTFISNETYKEEVKQVKIETAIRGIEQVAAEKGLKLTDEQIRSIDETIKQNWEALRIKDNEAGIKEFEANMRAQHPSVMNVVGSEFRRVINLTNDLTGSKDGGYYRYRGK